jgi:hypothetical protein
VFKAMGYRFFFFSREEARPHVHASCPDGQAKFRLEPAVSLARNYGLSEGQLQRLKKLVEERKHEITRAWRKHFRSGSD